MLRENQGAVSGSRGGGRSPFRSVSRLGIFALGYILATGLGWAEVRLPAIFSDHLVLQKSSEVPVWGWAAGGEKVTVQVAGQSAQTQADGNGRWMVKLNLEQAGPGPFEMVVQGGNRLAVADVLVGEVWVASGQSNMDWRLATTTGAAEEVAASANPQFREFKVVLKAAATPQDDCGGQWKIAAPDTSGVFSAISYYFGKKLQRELGVPVGMITTAMGGTPAESWMSPASIDSQPDSKAAKEKMIQFLQSYPQQVADFAARYREWENKFGRTDKRAEAPEKFAGVDVPLDTWKKVNMPAMFSSVGLPAGGAVWLRRKVPVDASRANLKLGMNSGVPHDFDEVYWNGVKVGETIAETPNSNGTRSYALPPAPQGESDLAIRVFSSGDHGGIEGDRNSFRVVCGGPGNIYYLPGEWLAKVEYEFPPLSPEARAARPVPPGTLPRESNISTWLFNGMVQPLLPFAIRGVIWYQGESNADSAFQYRSTFPRLIEDWRKQWGRGDFPFYFCQIANYRAKETAPVESDWAELREAQSMTLSLPQTGQAVLIDIGETEDIHPRNKKEAADRLARLALARTYGQKVVDSGPVFKSAKIEGSKIRVLWDHVEGGLKAHPVPATDQSRSTDPKTVPLVRNSPQSELEGFAICGKDQKWVWADAGIDGDSVVVWSPEVGEPVAVRYGWANNPTCNLYNGAGLPAAPFRTDDFPANTRDRKHGF